MGFQDRQYYREQENFNPLSIDRHSIVAILIIINVAIFVVDMFTPRIDPKSGMQSLAYYLGVRQDHPWQVWSYLTYGFAHESLATETSFWHLLSNMLVLFFLGRAVESTLGRQEFLRFYLISIVVCGIGFMVLRSLLNYDFQSLVGASGGVSAVTALFIFMFPTAILYLFGVLPVPAWVLGLVLLLHNLIIAADPDSNTAWEAHLIGFAFGAAYFFGKWNFASLSLPKLSGWGKSRPSLKIHDPDLVDAKLQAEADQILKKINEQGEASLTTRERKTLNRYSQLLRERRK
jgi:membrane associated rhomboid family serine protease